MQQDSRAALGTTVPGIASMQQDSRTHSSAAVALGTTLPGIPCGVFPGMLTPPPPLGKSLESENGKGSGLQLPVLQELQLRSMPIAAQREHANFLCRSLTHKNIGAVPVADHELAAWILQIQSVHIEPVRTISPSPSVMGMSVSAMPGPLLRPMSPRTASAWTAPRSVSPSPWAGAAPCAAPVRTLSPMPKPQVTPLPTTPSGVPPSVVPPLSPLPPQVLPSYTPRAVMPPMRLNVVPSQPQLQVNQSQIIPPPHLSRIDSAIEEMERELDMNQDSRSLRDTPAAGAYDLNGMRSDNENTVDWLDKQISEIATRRDVFNKRQGSDSLNRSYSERFLQSRIEPGFGHSRLSVLEADHISLKRQVSEMEFNQEREDAENDRAVLERAHWDALDALENERHQGAVLRQQLMESQAACDLERRRADEFSQARELADLDLRKLEESSKAVLQQCKQLQDRVREMELGNAENNDAALALHVNRIALLQEELDLAHGKHSTHEGRIRDLEGLNSTHVARVDELLRELNDLRQNGTRNDDDSRAELEHSLKKQHEHHQKHVKNLEDELDELKKTASKHGELTREKHAHAQRVIELEGLVADYLAGEENHKRLHSQNKLKHSELEQLLHEQQQRHLSEIGQHRSRHLDLEQQIEEHLENQRNSHRQHGVHKNKISDLEREILDHESEKESLKRHLQTTRQQLREREAALADAELEQGSRSQQHNMHLVKIQDLEQRLLDAEAAEQGHKQKLSTHALRISELEALIEEHENGVARHSQKHDASRARIQELEQSLSEAESATSNHQRQCQSHKSKILELEQFLEDLQQEEQRHNQKHTSNRQLLLQYEEQLKEMEGTHQNRHQANTTKIKELELLLEQHVKEIENHKGMRQTSTVKLADMESRIAEYELSQAELQRKHDYIFGEHQSRTQELERTKIECADLKLRLAESEELHRKKAELEKGPGSASHEIERLRQELQSVSEAKLKLQDEMQKMFAKVHQVEQEKDIEARRSLKLQEELQGIEIDAREAAIRQDSRYRDVEVQARDHAEKLQREQVKVQKLEARIQELEQQLLTQSQRSPIPKVSFRETPKKERLSVGNNARMSIFIDQITEKRRAEGEILPGSADPFVQKVRDALKNAAEAHDASSQTHMIAIEHQLAAVKQARDSGLDHLEALQIYPQKALVEAEQRTALSNVEAASHELKSLLQELEVHHQLNQAEHDIIKTSLSNELEKCLAEQVLLKDAASIASLNDRLINHLLDIHGTGKVDTQRVWDGGMSPVHHAAKLGRRDILQYLLALEGGRDLLHMSDAQGNTPSFYASRHAYLEQWLNDFAGASKPIQMHSGERRPSVSMIPPQYLNLLHQIEKSGWNNVNWKNGFTMLHWAANKGNSHAELCGYLITLHGDPNKKDSQDRTPLSLARDGGHNEVVAVLEDRMKRSSIYRAGYSFAS